MPHISQASELFCNELVAYYPQHEQRPWAPERVESDADLPYPPPEWDAAFGLVETDPFESFGLDVMLGYLRLARTDIALQQMSEPEKQLVTSKRISAFYEDPDEIHVQRKQYIERIGQMPQYLPREAAALYAGFATSNQWENRELAASILPQLVEVAPEVTVMLLDRLQKDNQSGIVREAAEKAANSEAMKEGLGSIVLRSSPPEQPYWHKAGWLPENEKVVVHESELITFLQERNFGERRVRGAYSTLDFRGQLLYGDKVLHDYLRVQPGCPADLRFSGDRNDQTFHVELQSLYTKLWVSAMHPREWRPFAVHFGSSEVQHSAEAIEQHISAVGLFVNHRLQPDEPLPLWEEHLTDGARKDKSFELEHSQADS